MVLKADADANGEKSSCTCMMGRCLSLHPPTVITSFYLLKEFTFCHDGCLYKNLLMAHGGPPSPARHLLPGKGGVHTPHGHCANRPRIVPSLPVLLAEASARGRYHDPV